MSSQPVTPGPLQQTSPHHALQRSLFVSVWRFHPHPTAPGEDLVPAPLHHQRPHLAQLRQHIIGQCRRRLTEHVAGENLLRRVLDDLGDVGRAA